ncbi:hypothetical protein RB653_006660 [Dictyostelium firmibasis]|uniref:Peroxin-7 n=1 Tax=Dictyostelium firmibasis TaxID=79012 RepID=A0AAN7YTY2_9MYCE
MTPSSISYLKLNNDKTKLGVCKSNLTNSIWNGCIEFFDINNNNNNNNNTNNNKFNEPPSKSIPFYSGTTCLEWIDNEKCLVSADDSNIYLLNCCLKEKEEDENNKNKPKNILEDDSILFEKVHNNSIISHLNLNLKTKQLLSSGWDKLIKQWDINTNSLISEFSLHYKKVNQTIWSEFNEFLFLSGSDNGVVIWDSRINISSIGKNKSIFLNETNGIPVNSVCWSKEHDYLFYGGLKSGSIKQFDIRSPTMNSMNTSNYDDDGSNNRNWKLHELGINQLSINPNNSNQLVSVSDDSLLKVFNIKTQEIIYKYRCTDFIKSFDFNSNNDNVIIGSIDNNLNILNY